MEPEQTPTAPPAVPTQEPASAQFTPLGQTAATAGAPDEYATPGWSWGAFMLGPFFLIGIRQYVHLWWYLLSFIPFVLLGIMIWLGMKGREMAATSKTFTTRDQYVGYMKASDHAGKVWFFVMLALVALWILFFATMMGALVGELNSYGTQEMQIQYDVRDVK